jgi:predicted TIM-barrel fold metal-dependent hydrolase
VYSCFFKDPIGVKMLDQVGGAEHVCFETDYPHSDSTWPKSREVLEAHFKDIPADERTLIAGANAAKLYGLN